MFLVENYTSETVVSPAKSLNQKKNKLRKMIGRKITFPFGH